MLRLQDEGFSKISPHFGVGTVWNKVFSILKGRVFLVKNSDGNLMTARPSLYDDVVALFGRIEEKKIETLFADECRQGSTILDVGAHIGRYVLLAADRVGMSGKVIACEPHPANFSILLRNIELNRHTNVIPKNVALSAEDGVAQLSLGDDSGLHSIVYNQESTSREKLGVKSSTIDSLLKELRVERVSLCKIDVEGAELLVLKGAEYSLKERKIEQFICEVHKGIRLDQVEQFFRKWGFLTETFRNFVRSYYPTSEGVQAWETSKTC
jgi:FkbM family methyltransferase